MLLIFEDEKMPNGEVDSQKGEKIIWKMKLIKMLIKKMNFNGHSLKFLMLIE